MKKYLLSATAMALVLSAGSALGADLPVRKAPAYVPPPAPMWGGFYVGLNAGWTWGHDDHVRTTVVDNEGATLRHLSQESGDGPTAGVQFGYNHQLAPNFMVGFEADLQGLDAETTIRIRSHFDAIRTNTDWLGTVRVRAGFLPDPNVFVFGTFGLAYGGVETHIFHHRFEDTLVGWTAGAGVEWLIMPNVSVKGEFLYFDLGEETFRTVTSSGEVVTRIDHDGFIVRGGINLHFGWGSPPIR
jgi:outer membrane immunogenic protein